MDIAELESDQEESLSGDTWVLSDSEEVEDDDNNSWPTMAIRRLLEGRERIPQADDTGGDANENGNAMLSWRRFNDMLADGFGAQYRAECREPDDDGTVPLRVINNSRYSTFAFGLIFTSQAPQKIKYRFFPVDSSRDILAKVDEDFVFTVYPHYLPEHKQPVGFCTTNSTKLEYYLHAGVASEITICNKFQGLRSLKHLCADAVLASTGNSLAAVEQLPLPEPLRHQLIDHLNDQTDNSSFLRAKKWLDAWLAWMGWLD